MNNYKRTLLISISALCLTALTGCSLLNFKIPKETLSNNDFGNLTFSEDEAKLVGKSNADWGLALSGGGIRASAYSLGVMKSLYDQGLLQKIDVISAVSGGGYAAYWLLTSETSNSLAFGDNAFSSSIVSDITSVSNDNFIENTCNFMNSANFATYPKMVKAVLKREPLSEFYRCKIERTYGWNDKSIGEHKAYETCLENPSDSTQIHSLKIAVLDKKIPYFIFNTTMVKPTSTIGWADGLYEFTPLFRGNTQYGYVPWGDESLPLSQVSAISGAAVKKLLKQKIPHNHPSIESDVIELSDGGHSENLGVIALVRRGVRNIIVADAELDPDLTFEGYYILKDRLAAWGLELKYEHLDERETIDPQGKRWWERKKVNDVPQGSFVAKIYKTAQPQELVSTLYYQKMSLLGKIQDLPREQKFQSTPSEPTKLDNCIPDNKGTCMLTAKELYEPSESLTQNALICDQLNQKTTKNGSCQDIGYKDCSLLRGKGFRGADWIAQNAILRIDKTLDEQIDKKFPAQPTVDQSFFLDQFTAYMGLGYLQTNTANIKNLNGNPK